jgi:hypothetical protein
LEDAMKKTPTAQEVLTKTASENGWSGDVREPYLTVFTRDRWRLSVWFTTSGRVSMAWLTDNHDDTRAVVETAARGKREAVSALLGG